MNQRNETVCVSLSLMMLSSLSPSKQRTCFYYFFNHTEISFWYHLQIVVLEFVLENKMARTVRKLLFVFFLIDLINRNRLSCKPHPDVVFISSSSQIEYYLL